ncbi:hypothetical protein THAOC_18712 [Thalassiosira oceanica]|uniref:Uncharacterized protein n=1 Tax=Thalassiosira oceanica TaxID=159749 RepID=K0S6I4_THAOC|nr:hypothetical protein THAOC_18712 [Thalassiosira oceanica]|eukprot:EJK60870.1 hypothetical protein THAOC_18712 [Thalassiosira oceanica]
MKLCFFVYTRLLLGGALHRSAGTAPLRHETAAGLLLLGEALGHELLVRGHVLLVAEHGRELGGLARALPLQDEGGDVALDLGGAADLLALLAGEGAADDVLADVVLLGEVEELADLRRALGSEAAGDGRVGEAGDLGVSLLDDGEVEHGDVLADDAAADGLALALTRAAGAVSLVSLVHQEANAGVGEDALAHGETLLVVSSGDAHDVAGELLAEDGAVDLLGHAPLVEVLEALLIVDLDDLLEARGGAGDVDLRTEAGGQAEVKTGVSSFTVAVVGSGCCPLSSLRNSHLHRRGFRLLQQSVAFVVAMVAAAGGGGLAFGFSPPPISLVAQ